MDQEKLLNHLDQRYIAKHDLLTHLPLNAASDALWEELTRRRRSRGTVLPLHDSKGSYYWYVTTDKMIAASEKIVSALLEGSETFDPYADPPTVTTLEEVFFTSYVEGFRMTMQEAMGFLQSGMQPNEIEEKIILNNRQAGAYASANLFRPVDEDFIRALDYFLTDGMAECGPDYRVVDMLDIPAMGDEEYPLPAAALIPRLIKELVSFLAMPSQHPLIKSAVAQAWMMTIRPFAEGNERLGRMLSNVILLRSGYTFFGDVSISAIIARNSFGYYTSMANILRSENESDLTYFIEFIMGILSLAVDEHQLKRQKKAEQDRLAEVELARIPLNSGTQGSDYSPTSPADYASFSSASFGSVDDLSSAVEAPITETDDQQDIPETNPGIGDNELDPPFDLLQGRVQLELLQHAERSRGIVNRVAIALAAFLDEGKVNFTVADLAKDLELSNEQIQNALSHFRSTGLIKSVGKVGYMADYTFCTDLPLFTPAEYSREILQSIQRLKSASHSNRDRRLGKLLEYCLPKGIIARRDYDSADYPTRWSEDMRLALQMGIVEKITPQAFRIAKDRIPGYPQLRKSQKEIITAMFKKYRHNEFSLDMFVEAFNCSNAHASATLHELNLLHIVACRQGNVKLYHILVNPRENPEFFKDAA